MQHVYDLALVGLAHIALTERDQGQHDDADGHRTENSNCDVGFEHGGSSDGLSLQDVSPEELWDALVTAIEEGEAHGSGSLGSPALGLRIALDDQLAQLQGSVGGVGNVSGLPSRQPGLRDTGTPADLALREVVLLAQPHQQTSCFALVFAHETSS